MVSGGSFLLLPVALSIFLQHCTIISVSACEGHHHESQSKDGSFFTMTTEGRWLQWKDFQDWTKSQEFQQRRSHVQCGSEEPTLQEMKAASRVTQDWLARKKQRTASRQQRVDPIRIQVKWHSIALDDGSNVATDQQILDSIDALNQAFAHPTSGGFAFDFDTNNDKTTTLNTDWHENTRQEDDVAYKSELREGDCTTLNIYTTGSHQGVFGWGTKPHRCDDDYENCYNRCVAEMERDGVVIRHELVAGGPVEDYNEGDVLIHEVGHWLGLYHTFQNGCDSPGDFIIDTPASSEPAFGCEEPKDSCTGKDNSPGGPDPIHNYMNLSNDPCMFEFTDGQFDWMYAQWDYYRANLGEGVDLVAQAEPTDAPSFSPTTDPPTFEPTPDPTLRPTPSPTPKPWSSVSLSIVLPTPMPTWEPAFTSISITLPPQPATPDPTSAPTPGPTRDPTSAPTPGPDTTTPNTTIPINMNDGNHTTIEGLTVSTSQQPNENNDFGFDDDDIEIDLLPPGLIDVGRYQGTPIEVEKEDYNHND